MRNLSLILSLLLLHVHLIGQDSPHGSDLNIACDVCHTSKSWLIDKSSYNYDHNTAEFPLTGQHEELDCKLCHTSLIFTDAGTECLACHADIHEQTVGFDCARCHSTNSWIVPNITEIHQHSRFPLLGAHTTADCFDCHPSETFLRFEPLGIECIDCHHNDFIASKVPDHVQGNFSTNCIECHLMNAFSWSGAGINHHFFLTTKKYI